MGSRVLMLGSLFLVVYHHFLYPILLWVLGRSRPDQKFEQLPEENLPTVALLIPARNEEASIAEKLDNSLALDYPKEKLTIFVLANGCTDRTADIVKQYAEKGVQLFEFGEIGKEMAQNEAVRQVSANILVFSDANTPYRPESLRRLVEPFADPTIGSVGGRKVVKNDNETIGSLEKTYWKSVEDVLRKLETRLGGVAGADGLIYAVRREHYVDIPAGVTSDLYLPLLVAAKGFRTVFQPDAIAEEQANKDFKAEFQRRIRITRHCISGIRTYPWLLFPWKTGRLSFVLWSHKMIRWFEPFLLGLALLAAMWRMITGKARNFEVIVFGGATLAGFLGLLGRGMGREKPVKIITQVYYLLSTFYAVATGVVFAFTKGRLGVWSHER